MPIYNVLPLCLGDAYSVSALIPRRDYFLGWPLVPKLAPEGWNASNIFHGTWDDVVERDQATSADEWGPEFEVPPDALQTVITVDEQQVERPSVEMSLHSPSRGVEVRVGAKRDNSLAGSSKALVKSPSG